MTETPAGTATTLVLEMEIYISQLQERERGGQYYIHPTQLCSELADVVLDAGATFEQLPPQVEYLRQHWVSLSRTATSNKSQAGKPMTEIIKLLNDAKSGKLEALLR